MEDLRYQSWSLSRQLNALYGTVEQICGARVTVDKRDAARPVDDDIHQAHMLLDGLRRQDATLRQQIYDLLGKLPLRRPQNEIQANGTSAAEALRHFLVANGGETGGWDAKDHALFLQWRSRFRNNRQTFISAVCDTVPGKNAAQVEAHEKWYQNLQRLRKEQRQELDEWKRQKKILDEEDRKRAAEESVQDESDPWVAQWRRQRVTIRQQLERWKEEKAAKAIEPAPTEETTEELRKKAHAEQKRRNEQQYQKLVAYLWRMEQEAAKVASESADHYLARLAKREKSQSSLQLMMERRQQRDREWLQQRRQLLTRQQQQQQPPKSALRRAVSVPRDPQRHLRPTSASVARLLPDEIPSSRPQRPGSSYILDIQSRTVPSWRQQSTTTTR